MTTEKLQAVLGQDFWTARFPTSAAATNHACRRMEEGRDAVTWATAEGAYFAAWGVKA
jgi:hypothetical protein